MAKSKSFFGLRTKSTRSHTYSIWRGMQITKDRVTTVANPQTDQQMNHRMLMPMVANARAKLAGLVNHSFEGVDYGYKSLYEFSRLNLEKGKLTVTGYVPKGMADCGLADFIVSKGQILPTTVEWIGSDGTPVVSYPTSKNAQDLTLPEAQGEGTKPTQANLEAIAAGFGLRAGDQLTFLAMGQNQSAVFVNGGASRADAYRLTNFAVARLILGGDDWADNDFTAVSATTAKANISTLSLQNGYFQLNFTGIQEDDNALGIEVAVRSDTGFHGASPLCAGLACIVSRKNGSTWQRSTQRIVINDGNGASNAISNVWGINGARNTYMKASTNSTKYLNNGASATDILGDLVDSLK